MKVGIKNQIKKTVVEELTAKVMGSGRLDVFATPAMVAMMEEAAHTSVEAELEEGQGTVGTSMTVSHLAATPVGMEVTCESELVEVDGRKLVFEIKAMDEVGLIGEARHERFIIENEKFLAKTNAKLK
ncbi:MAG: thioesterase family protein [[Eubacterium] sulci]|jgi:thioesterase superfamily protein|nr:thioesterase family protein [[Eubacterium] sulci]MBF1154774.1 thioesterase family protein [[Eubacterium] sulci]MBF1156122.1 thioesterase family protein [[Eubacterium] sulci]MBF1158113.1 thioesterase family protein [[Eubacterium] sulci]MBF1163061.1 thioesterase family protein [[Eubacterium] sulci]